MSLAIVLSGGGSRGDFQVGVLRYLYDRGIRPEILTTTSVGSINGIKLAEGEVSPRHGLAGLEQIWLEMNYNWQMYKEEQWLIELQDSKVKDFLLQASGNVAGTALGYAARWYYMPLLLLYDLTTAIIDIDKFMKTVEKAMKSFSLFNLSPIEKLLSDPQKLDQSQVGKTGIRLRMAMVALESGALRYVDENGNLLGRFDAGHFLTTSAEERQSAIRNHNFGNNGIIGYVYKDATLPSSGFPGSLERFPVAAGAPTTIMATDSASLPGTYILLPSLDRMANPDTGAYFCTSFANERDTAQQQNYRLEGSLGYVHRNQTATTVPLYRLVHPDKGFFYTTDTDERNDAVLNQAYVFDGIIGYVETTPSGMTVPLYRLNIARQPVQVDLVQSVLASAAIPCFFPTISLNGEHYVDGGVREILPIQAAVDLGATEIFAIEASVPIQPMRTALGHGNPNVPMMLDIALRSTADIMIDEITHNEIHPRGKGWGVPITVFRPQVDVHDPMTIDPALISISMDYGYMRAADTLDGHRNLNAISRITQLADEITLLRMKVQAIEAVIYLSPDKDYIREIRTLKWQIKALVDERKRLGGELPPSYSQWWLSWERKQSDKGASPMHTPWHSHDRWLDPTESRLFRIEAEDAPLGRDGTLLKEEDHPAVYVIYGGAKFGFPSAEVFLKLGFRWEDVRTVPKNALCNDTTPPADGTLLKEPGSPAIFVTYGGMKFGIPSMDVFNRLGFSTSSVRTVPDGSLATLPHLPQDGTLLKEYSSVAVFVTYGGMKFGIPSMDVFNRLGFSTSSVRTVPDGAVTSLPTTPVDGTLLKELSNATVYVTNDGGKIGISSAKAFSAAGYNWTKVRVVPDGALAALPDKGVI